MTTHFNIDSTINDFVQEDVRRTALLEQLGVDACCGGHKTLAQACGEKGLDPESVLQKILAGSKEDEALAAVTEGMDGSLTEAVDHLLKTHHTFLKEALPRLAALTEKVVAAHLSRHPELKTLQELFADLQADLEPHLMKEEQVLFPIIKVLETSGGNAEFHCGSVQNPIRVMQMEHEQALTLFDKIRETTRNHAVPEDGCESYRLLMAGLQELEADTRLHIRKENEILFPQILALEEDAV